MNLISVVHQTSVPYPLLNQVRWLSTDIPGSFADPHQPPLCKETHWNSVCTQKLWLSTQQVMPPGCYRAKSAKPLSPAPSPASYQPRVRERWKESVGLISCQEEGSASCTPCIPSLVQQRTVSIPCPSSFQVLGPVNWSSSGKGSDDFSLLPTLPPNQRQL